MQQHWATLAHQTRALIDREQSEQDQLRHQLFQLILWGGAALSIGLLALARWIIRTIVRPLRTCRIPSDHIPIRSWPLFLARELMRDLIETLKAEQST